MKLGWQVSQEEYEYTRYKQISGSCAPAGTDTDQSLPRHVCPPLLSVARSARSDCTAASRAFTYCRQLQRPPGKSCEAWARKGSLRRVRPLKPSAARATSSRHRLQGWVGRVGGGGVGEMGTV